MKKVEEEIPIKEYKPKSLQERTMDIKKIYSMSSMKKKKKRKGRS